MRGDANSAWSACLHLINGLRITLILVIYRYQKRVGGFCHDGCFKDIFESLKSMPCGGECLNN